MSWFTKYDPDDIDIEDLDSIVNDHGQATNGACECRYCMNYLTRTGWL
jgi:hypothetical protein